MKPKFRVRFEGMGWVVQYSYLGILWSACGGRYYRSQEYAEGIRDDLRNGGLAPVDWYDKEKK